MRPLTQLIFEKLTHASNKFSISIFLLLRRIILSFCDPLVTYKMGKSELQLPLSHELPINRVIHPLYSSNLGRIVKQVHQRIPDLAAIDIGANVGDSVMIIRNETSCPILAVEGDDSFFLILKKNCQAFPDVVCERAFVAGQAGSLAVERVRERGSTHWQPSISSKENVSTLSQILLKFPRFLSARFLKLDTDGFDCSIIRGAADHIKKMRPVIFFEYDPAHLSRHGDSERSIFTDLAQWGFPYCLVYMNNGDYLLALDLKCEDIAEDLHHYFSGRNNLLYCDICVFPEEFKDLFLQLRTSELAFFKAWRSY